MFVNLKKVKRLAALLFLSAAIFAGVPARTQTPEISYLELPTNAPKYVYIHFDAPAGHTYYLQRAFGLSCTNCGTNKILTTNWSNIFTGLNYPPPNGFQHYIIVEPRTNQSRFYRLRMTTP